MKDGTIDIGESFRIDNKFDLADLKVVGKSFNITPVVSNGEYNSFKTDAIRFFNKDVIFTLYFEYGKIKRVSLNFVSGGAGWSENVQAEEMKKKQDQDSWLKNILKGMPPYDFKWGKVESVYDPRATISSVVISFY